MIENLNKIKNVVLHNINSSNKLTQIDEIRVKYLGKKGELTNLFKQMSHLTKEEKPIIGKLANDLRLEIEKAINLKIKSIKETNLLNKLSEEKIDVTLPGTKKTLGHVHPLTTVLREIEHIFISMGFSVTEGPEVEYSYYNFDALNIPKDHPSRDKQDTFYINNNVVLRTQTSSVQIRVMKTQSPPIRVISPGRVYRFDEVDATHSPIFNQVEGLMIDKNIKFSDLKGTLELFVKSLYGNKAIVRFRPHHFPFTEPSAEVDMQCFVCGGKGCRLCKNEGWIEILGCGMVHPNVLTECHIDPNIYSGFAFGLGLERIVMRRYNIHDIRLLYDNDFRFLSQF